MSWRRSLIVAVVGLAFFVSSAAVAFGAPTYGSIYLDHPDNPARLPWNQPGASADVDSFESALIPRVFISRENTWTTTMSGAERSEASENPWNSYGTFVAENFQTAKVSLTGSGLASTTVEPSTGAIVFSLGRFAFKGHGGSAPWVDPSGSYTRWTRTTGSHPAAYFGLDNPSGTDPQLKVDAKHLADVQSNPTTASVPTTSGVMDGSWKTELPWGAGKGVIDYGEAAIVAVKQDDGLYDLIVLFGYGGVESRGDGFRVVAWDERVNQTWANVLTLTMDYNFGPGPSMFEGVGHTHQAWTASYTSKAWAAGNAVPEDLGQDLLDSLRYGIDYLNLPDADDAGAPSGTPDGPLASIDSTDLATFLDLPAGLLPDWFLEWINEHVIDPINGLAGQIATLFWPVTWVNDSILGGATP